MTYRYYHRHPRGFSNECAPIRVPADRQDMIDYMERRVSLDGGKPVYEATKRITRREMQRHLRSIDYMAVTPLNDTGLNAIPILTDDDQPRCNLCGRKLGWTHNTNCDCKPA